MDDDHHLDRVIKASKRPGPAAVEGSAPEPKPGFAIPTK